MDSRVKSFVKVGARLVGVTFGLAVALFLFSSVAFGHSYDGHSNGCYNRGNNYRVSYTNYRRMRYTPCRHVRVVRYNVRYNNGCRNQYGNQYGHGSSSNVLAYQR
jgi:hypothetical protein